MAELNHETIDGAIICTPAVLHEKIGTFILRQGVPCLIEKPLGTTAQECDDSIAASREGNTFILAGHLENFNPAVLRLRQELDCPIKSIQAIRTSRPKVLRSLKIRPKVGKITP